MAFEINDEVTVSVDTSDQSPVAVALLSDAYDVAKFADKYPRWMYETIQPLLLGLANGENDKLDERQKHFFSPTETIASDASIKNNQLPADFEKIPSPGDFRGTIKIDGIERDYLLHVPPGYDASKSAPLVMALHGLGGNASQFARLSEVSNLADKYNFLVVYPEARAWFGEKQLKVWDAENGLVHGRQGDEDLKFLRAIIEKTERQANIDNQRIYVTGISNGGMMTFDAAAALSDKIAAIAVVSGAMSGKERLPNQPLSVLNIHGTDDGIIPIEGVEDVPKLLSEVGVPTLKPNWYVSNYWNAVDGTVGPSQIEIKDNQVIERWTNIKNGAEVEQRIILGGQHQLDDPARTAGVIWDFFARHPKIALTNAQPGNLPRETSATEQNKDVNTFPLITKIDGLVQRLQNIPDGSFSPAKLYTKLEGGLQSKLSSRCDQFFRATDTASKLGSHFEIKLNAPQKLPLSVSVPAFGTTINLDDIEISNLSFDVNKKNDLLRIEHVSGLSVHGNFWGLNMTSRVEDIAEQVNKDGTHFYRLEFENPLPYVARQVLMTPDKLSVDVKIETNGAATIIH